MGDLAQRRRLYHSTHLRIGAVGPHQMRKSCLKLIVPPHQSIKLRVGYLGRIMCMIELVMMRNRLRQTHQFIGSFGFGEVFNLAHTSSISRAACARASSVISAPESMRAIS